MENEQNIKNKIEYPKDGIISKEIKETDKIEVTLFSMAKNTDISKHTSTKEGFLYVIEGQGTFNFKDRSVEMKPGVFMFIEENKVHSLKAAENTSFLLTLHK